MALFPKCGGPKLDVQLHHIRLRIDVFKKLLRQKALLEWQNQTHSEFATYLLQILGEKKRVVGATSIIPSSTPKS